MSIELTLVIGPSNAGKSSLIRCLTGRGRGCNEHPNEANIRTLDWQGKKHETLVLESSLNEGVPMQPRDLGPMLDEYTKPGFNVTRAIIAISTSSSGSLPRVYDYGKEFDVRGIMSSHSFKHRIECLVLLENEQGETGLTKPFISNSGFKQRQFSWYPSNLVALTVRPFIGIS